MLAMGTARRACLQDLRAVNAEIASVTPFTYPNNRSTQDHLKELRRRRNSFLLVNQLPTELLSEIFLHTHAGAHNQEWLPVTQVCSFWRSICLGLGPLWSDISDDDALEWANCCMERSGHASLCICMWRDADEDGNARMEVAKLGIDRCRKLVASGSAERGVEHFKHLLGRAPRLEELHLHYDDDAGVDMAPEIPAQLFACHTPRLKVLDITACSFHLASPFFAGLSNLENIVFDSIPGSKRQSSACFLGLLQRSPGLRQLELSQSLPEALDTHVELAELTRLHVWDNKLSMSQDFLRHVSFPRANDISFNLYCINLSRNKNHERTVSLVSHLMEYVKVRLSRESVLVASIAFSKRTFSLQYDVMTSEAELSFQPYGHPSRLLSVSCDIRSTGDPTPLWKTMSACTSTWLDPRLCRRIHKLRVGDWGIIGVAPSYLLQFWLPILRSMSQVRHLILSGHPGAAFLGMLSESRDNDPFPALERLVLERHDLRPSEPMGYICCFLERRRRVIDSIHLVNCRGAYLGALTSLSYYTREDVTVTDTR